jgi:hypothetical protein
MNSLQCAAICLITRKSGYSVGNLFCGALPSPPRRLMHGHRAHRERGRAACKICTHAGKTNRGRMCVSIEQRIKI